MGGICGLGLGVRASFTRPQTTRPGADLCLSISWLCVFWFSPYSGLVFPHGGKMVAEAPPLQLCLFYHSSISLGVIVFWTLLSHAYPWPITEAKEIQCAVWFRQGRSGEEGWFLGCCVHRNKEWVQGGCVL